MPKGSPQIVQNSLNRNPNFSDRNKMVSTALVEMSTHHNVIVNLILSISENNCEQCPNVHLQFYADQLDAKTYSI